MSRRNLNSIASSNYVDVFNAKDKPIQTWRCDYKRKARSGLVAHKMQTQTMRQGMDGLSIFSTFEKFRRFQAGPQVIIFIPQAISERKGITQILYN